MCTFGGCGPRSMIRSSENSSTPCGASAMSSKTGVELMTRPGWSLATRLTLWYTGAAFILVVAAVGFLYWALVTTLEHEDDQFLINKANMVFAAMRDDPGDLRELRN